MSRKLLVGALVALVLSLTTLGVGSKSASAEVVENSWHEFSRTLVNPCNGLTITLSGEFHTVWYTTPDGHTMMRTNAHLTGTDTAGTKYIYNARRVMDHEQWPTMFPFDDVMVWDVVSRGGGDNFRITITVDNATGEPIPYDIDWTCKG
ncbi:MAG: hypothetical protein IH609_16480 [Dehalococcoidia bacterium]|nr:hypothetical protein [Dehalococcoidia bacterium]